VNLRFPSILCLLFTPLCWAADPQPVGVLPPSGSSWQLNFADEFEGSALNTSVWSAYHSTYGDGNFELQCYKPTNATVGGGLLTLTAKQEDYRCPTWSSELGFRTPNRQYTSAFLGTRENNHFFPRFGYYEARLRFPRQRGLWPAFWLRHRDGSNVVEIDAMESFPAQAPNGVSTTIHYTPRYNVWRGYVSLGSAAASPEWLVVGVSILPRNDGEVEIAYYYDGQIVQRTGGLVTPTPFRTGLCADGSCFSAEAFERHPGQGLFDIALNLGIGGFDAGNPDADAQTWSCHYNSSWITVADPSQVPSGAKYISRPLAMPDSSLAYRTCLGPVPVHAASVAPIFPAQYQIDYVRVWSLVGDRLFADGFENR
jgi:hypothetical protein